MSSFLPNKETLSADPDRRLEAVEPGRMWVHPQYRDGLEQAGLKDFDAVMQTTQGHCLRALKDRENWRLEVHPPHGKPRGAYLKKHHLRTWKNWLRAKFGLAPEETPGRVEAENVARLEAAGIPSMRLIAYGEKLHSDGLLESFLLTEELEGFTQLDHFLRRRFVRSTEQPTNGQDKELNQLIREVALLARKFHEHGYNHRDMYCCHFFIREGVPGEFETHLIDLQRVELRHRFRSRWIVKDLAQLAYSAPRERIRCTQKMAFIKHYLGVKKLRPQDKRLIRRVLAKQSWMEWQLGKHP